MTEIVWSEEVEITPQNWCPDCHGKGSIRIHAPEDYGISFESGECETCGGTGINETARRSAA